MKVFSSVHFLDAGSTDALLDACKTAAEAGARGILAIIGEAAPYDIDALPAMFRDLSVPAFAIIAPGVIHGSRDTADGTLVIGLSEVTSALLIKDVDEVDERQLAWQIAQWRDAHTPANVLVFVDAAVDDIDRVVDCVHDQLGSDVRAAGGGVGSFSNAARPSMVDAGGCYRKAVLAIGVQSGMVFSTGHGFESIAGPFLVSAADGKLIRTINYRPAAEVYRETIEAYAGHALDLSDFYAVSQQYPFGLSQLDDQFLVREPIDQRDDGTLVCTAAIPTNSLVYVLASDRGRLLHSAGATAAQLAPALSPAYATRDDYFVAAIVCVSRKLIFTSNYHRELDAIRGSLPPRAGIVGMLSVGEIASTAQGRTAYMNKTIVLGALGKGS